MVEKIDKSVWQSLHERYLYKTAEFAAWFVKRFDSLRADQAEIYNAATRNEW